MQYVFRFLCWVMDGLRGRTRLSRYNDGFIQGFARARRLIRYAHLDNLRAMVVSCAICYFSQVHAQVVVGTALLEEKVTSHGPAVTKTQTVAQVNGLSNASDGQREGQNTAGQATPFAVTNVRSLQAVPPAAVAILENTTRSVEKILGDGIAASQEGRLFSLQQRAEKIQSEDALTDKAIIENDVNVNNQQATERSNEQNAQNFSIITEYKAQKNKIQQGLASWYGPGFHGKLTASGEIFNQNIFTAAHRTLPLKSYARITNSQNGQSIIVKINDRGPYVGKRILDLSRAAAKALGFIGAGVAHIVVEPLSVNK